MMITKQKQQQFKKKNSSNGKSLAVQWLGLCAFTAGDTGLIPG